MNLELLRQQIDEVDHELVSLLSVRMGIIRQIAKVKKEKGLPILDEKREEELLQKISKWAQECNLSPASVQRFYRLLLEESKNAMKEVK